jgi:hypothetical protein
MRRSREGELGTEGRAEGEMKGEGRRRRRHAEQPRCQRVTAQLALVVLLLVLDAGLQRGRRRGGSEAVARQPQRCCHQ